MADLESQFPDRMRGIWRSGHLRPNDFTPEPKPPGSRRRGDYRERGTDVERDAAADLKAAAGRLQGDGEGGLPDISEVGRHFLDLARRARREASEKASTLAPPRRRRSALASAIRSLIVLAVLGVIVGNIIGVDWDWLAFEAERALGALLRELFG